MGDLQEEVMIGKVEDYIDMIGMALIDLTNGSLSVGDSIFVRWADGNLSQVVEEMEIDEEPVTRAEMGTKVKVKMDDKVAAGADVFRVLLQAGA